MSPQAIVVSRTFFRGGPLVIPATPEGQCGCLPPDSPLHTLLRIMAPEALSLR